MTTRILSSDLLICDVLLKLQNQPKLAPLIEEYNHNHPEHPIVIGSKSPLNSEEFMRWKNAVGSTGSYVAGGSAANTLSTLKKLLGDEVRVDFIAAYGADAAGKVIAESLVQDGFDVLPQNTSFPDVQTATSYVMIELNGERSIVGYAGNSRQKILAHFALAPLPEDYDILFLPGSLWHKYGEEFAEKLYKNCLQAGKQLWLSLPTHSQAGAGFNEVIKAIIPSAQVVLANAEELKRLYANDSLNESLKALQSAMCNHVAFITEGRQGASVVTQKNIIHVSSEKISAHDIKNTLGAGDAAFAGFLCGVIKKLSHEKSAEIAMKLAAENMKHASARISDVIKIKSFIAS